MRIWNKSAAAGGVAHPFEQVEPGHERRVCSCKTAEWRWVDAGTPSDKDKCRGGLILEREEARRERDALRTACRKMLNGWPDLDDDGAWINAEAEGDMIEGIRAALGDLAEAVAAA